MRNILQYTSQHNIAIFSPFLIDFSSFYLKHVWWIYQKIFEKYNIDILAPAQTTSFFFKREASQWKRFSNYAKWKKDKRSKMTRVC